MTKRIAVDDATFVTLKKLADKNGRTMVGQLRWLLNEQGVASKAEEPSELQQMVNRLRYFEEGSPEYEEAVKKISELQKNA